MAELATRGAEITKLDNKLEELRNQVEEKTKVRNALVDEISKKTENFEIYMTGRTNEDKKVRADLIAMREQLTKDQAEFSTMLLAHRNDKNTLENQKRDLEIQKVRHAGTVQNVQEFVTAIRRAVGLLGF